MTSAKNKRFSPYVREPRIEVLQDEAFALRDHDATAAERVTTFFRRSFHSLTEGSISERLTLVLARPPLPAAPPMLPAPPPRTERPLLRRKEQSSAAPAWVLAGLGFAVAIAALVALRTPPRLAAVPPAHAPALVAATPAAPAAAVVTFDDGAAIKTVAKARPVRHRAPAVAAKATKAATAPAKKSIEDELADEQLRAAER